MNRQIVRISVSMLMVALATACLRTRSDVKDVEQRQVLSQQVNTLQRDTADVNSRFSEVNEELRALRGRVEVVENRINRGDTESDRSRQALTEQAQDSSRRAALLQESVVRLDTQVQALNAEVQALRAEIASGRAQQAAGSAAAKGNTWDAGVKQFDQKNWKKAILSFQEYREKNPKGKNVPEATYRMGVSFQELGMKDEAKTFFDEVVSRWPKSQEAKKAKTRLKNLKSSKK